MRKEKFLPSLVAGFSLAVLSVVPIIQITTCCLLAPLAGLFSVNLFYLQMKKHPEFNIEKSDGFQIGILIGFISGFFESIFQSLLILVSKDNPVYDSIVLMQQYLPDTKMPDLIYSISKEIDEKRFSALLSFMLFFNATIVNSIFATIGALLGVSNIKKRIIRDSFS
ncbi:MAG: hypothetical protein WHV63_03995 [Ignavibacteria bacterium]